MTEMLTFDEATTGVAAGIPYLALPPAGGVTTAPLIVAWHAFGPPRSEAALAGSLPMAGVPAWRVYPGLPMFGGRLPEGGHAELERRWDSDYLLELFGPIVEQAAAELSRMVAELRTALPIDQGPVGLAGVGAGGGAALLALAESRVPVAAAGLVNPIASPAPVLPRVQRRPYRWTDTAREIATWLDFTGRGAELAARNPQAAILIINGGRDDVVRPEHGAALYDALRLHYGTDDRLKHIVVPDLAHPLGPEPGLEPAPPSPGPVLADKALTEWFVRHLTHG